MLRFGLAVGQMVVGFVSRTAAFTAKLLDMFVAIGAFTAKQVCFLGVDPQEGNMWDHRDVFEQFSFVHSIPFETGLLQLQKAF